MERDEIRRSLAAMGRMVPTMLSGMAESDLQRAAPGRPLPLPAIERHLAQGDALVATLLGASQAATIAPVPDEPGETGERGDQDHLGRLQGHLRAQRAALCDWLDAQGDTVWQRPMPPTAAGTTRPDSPETQADAAPFVGTTIADACAALVEQDRDLLVLLGQHRNWLKGR